MNKQIKKELSTDDKIIESQLDVDQACNEFQLVGTTRIHVLKKFKTEKYTKSGWDIIFHREHVTA